VANIKQVLLPDIGDFPEVGIIEVLVAPGDRVQAEAPLVILESDKATLEIPAPWAGTVTEVAVKVGDQVNLETDLLGKYVQRYLQQGEGGQGRLLSLLLEQGFLGKGKGD